MTHKNNAQYQAAYRLRAKRAGGSVQRGRSGKSGKSGKSKWDAKEFIALDGEGENCGEEEIFTVESSGKKYAAKKHLYTLLAASTGESLYNGGKAIETMAAIDFLCDLSMAHTKATFVIFAGSYDINHILMYGFERSALKEIASGTTYAFKKADIEYQLEYRPRKSLTIRRGLSFYQAKKYNRKTGERDLVWKTKWASKIIVWDVFGFFQESFVGVMAKWLGKDHPHYGLIKRMKLKRGDFEHVPQSEINAYNQAELECLVEIMDKVHAAIDGLGLKCNRWDGAGAVAAAIMRKHDIKKFKNAYDFGEEIRDATATAYAGGRIEVCKIGVHDGPVYDYDINSAYPDVMRGLPCLAHGKWSSGGGEPPRGFTLVHCKYQFADGMPFYPLFYRTTAMQICFADRGEGMYWYPEYEAALLCPGMVEVIKWWHFEPGCNHKPFHWIDDYYKTRQQWVKHPTEEWQRGGEKIIKLGLNSLYGKTAQQLGGREGKAPAYHQLEWAGYITSATRARLYSAAMASPDVIIGFATDGIFATAPLPFPHSADKSIGEWDVKIFDGLTLAMAGVYWWHENERHGDKIHKLPITRYKHFSRGFDKDSMQTPEFVVNAWKRGDTTVDIKMYRLIGMGSACSNDTFYAMRGRFTSGERSLSLNGSSYKRGSIDVKKTKPWKQLVDIAPAHNIKYENGMQGCSHPYPLEWQKDSEFQKELEQERENEDTVNI